MEPQKSGAVELRRIASDALVLYDTSYPADDPRGIVARLTETEDDLVEVVWLQASSLPSLYLEASEVLADVARYRGGGRRSRHPDEIPHLPPFSSRTHPPRVA